MHEGITYFKRSNKSCFGAFSHESSTELPYCLSDYLFVFCKITADLRFNKSKSSVLTGPSCWHTISWRVWLPPLACGGINQHTHPCTQTQCPALAIILDRIFSVMAHHTSPGDWNAWSVNRILVSVSKWTTENWEGDCVCASTVAYKESWLFSLIQFHHLSSRILIVGTINISDWKLNCQPDAASLRIHTEYKN